MDIPSFEMLLDARRGLDKQNEEQFWQWVNPQNDGELFTVFGTAIRSLYVLKRAALIQRSHVDIELTLTLDRIVSHAFAVLALLQKGFVAEAFSSLRTVGEGCNLMLLLNSDEDELQLFLSANEDRRDSKFGASQVRAKLKGLKQGILMDNITYRMLSRRFSHFSTGSVFLNSSVYGTEIMDLEFHHANMGRSMLIWASFILAAMRLGLELVNYPHNDEAVSHLDNELDYAIDMLGARLSQNLGT